MDLLFAIFTLSLSGVVLATLAGWWVRRGYDGIGALVHRGDSGDWWQATMPWPQGVQEEDGVGWHIRDPDSSMGPQAKGHGPAEVAGDAFQVSPTRARSRIGLRRPPSQR